MIAIKTKRFAFLTFLVLTTVQYSLGQQRTISGIVNDNEGMPLIGANVIIQNSLKGTTTDFDGKYSIEASQGDVLEFSYIGFASKTVPVTTDDTVNVTLQLSNELDEVVVTALGISREKKSLGYATQSVDSEAVTTARETNLINSLSGKISGIDIKKSNTMGGSSNVIIRGYSSISQNNQPLFVIDGIPISNDNTNSVDQQRGEDGYDYGNAATDINPDDVETINVLKGAAATALYGSRATNGAIIITTKKGKASDRIGVTVNSTIAFGTIDKSTFPEYQNKYGAGYGPFYGPDEDGFFNSGDLNGDGNPDRVVPSTEDASFGGAFDGAPVYQWDSFYPRLSTFGTPRPWLPSENGPATIFNTSITNINNVSFSGGGENGTFRLSYTRMGTSGIMPNSTQNRHTLDFNGSTVLGKGLTVSVKATHIKTDTKGRPGTGFEVSNLMGAFRQWWQTNVDVQRQKEVYFATRENITWNPRGFSSEEELRPQYWDNLYWTLYENYQSDSRSRWLGNVSLNYKVNDWLDILGRVTIDTYSEMQEERVNISSILTPRYARFNRNFDELNYDFYLNFNKPISDKIGLRGVLGTNIRQTQVSSIRAQTNGGLGQPRLYALSNSANPINFPDELETDQKVIGFFANASIDYDSMVFLEGSLRRDQNSTLPSNANSYYYPSVSSSLIFSKLLNQEWLSFGKLRFGYAEVGNGAPPHSVNNTFDALAKFNGNYVYDLPGTRQNPDLKEERTTSLEAGLELSMFKRRLGLDLSVYDNRTKDLITAIEVTAATGFKNYFLNAGEIQNKGIELGLFGTPVKSPDFEWNVNVNWSKNDNLVVDLFADNKNILLNEFGGVTLNASKGEPYGVLKGTDYQYVDGKRLVGSDGLYVQTESQQEVIGNINPDWKAGINNSFKFKDITFSFLIDTQKGGDVFSIDNILGYGNGLYKGTAGLNDLGNPLRDPITDGPDSGGAILEGVTSDGSPNTVRADYTSTENPFGGRDDGGSAPDSEYVYDASYVKLREASLRYELPKKILDKIPFAGASITLSGRNLWILHKNIPFVDPEAGLSSGNLQGFQNGTYPSVREYSLNIKLEF